MDLRFGRALAAAIVAVCAVAGAARAADKPTFAPPAAWVQVAPIPVAHTGAGGSAVELLLDDNQARFGPKGDELYNRRVIRITKTEGLAEAVTREVTWDPEVDALTVHTLKIIRDGQVIDLLGDGSKMLVLRRETNLERAMIDGRLTASEQIPGLQVGDVLDWAYTIVSHDPVMKGHSQAFDSVSHQGVAGRVRIRYLWPDAKPMHWRANPAFTPAVTHRDGWSEMLIDLPEAVAPKPPLGAPKRFQAPGDVEITDFHDWAEVSALMAPLYAKAATLEPKSPLKAEIARIAAQTADPKAPAAAALALVEAKTRYLFIGIDSGGYTPAAADETWARRFGDCKGKTALLLALLQGLGVEAQPVLVSTTDGDALSTTLPSVRFDHVLVRAMISGKAYWLDGTRTGDDDGLDVLEPPGYVNGLTVASAGGALIHIDQRPLARPQIRGDVRLDASAGINRPVPADIRLVMTGDLARAASNVVARASEVDARRTMRESFGRSFGWLDIKDVTWSVEHDSFILHIAGTADLPWRENPDLGVNEFKMPAGATAGASSAFPVREPGPESDAPYAAPYPMFFTGSMAVVLPDEGRGFTVRGVNIDTVIGPFHIVRSARIEGGVARFTAAISTTGPEFPSEGIAKVNRELRRLSEQEEFVRAPKVEAAEGAGAQKPGAGAR